LIFANSVLIFANTDLMLVAIDAVGIRGHGGASVLTELSHWLPIVRPAWKWHVFLFDRDLREFDDPAVEGDVSFEHSRNGNSALARLVWVDFQLQKRLKEINPDVLFSFANIGPAKPWVPQVVFVQQPNAFFDEGIPNKEFLMRLRMKFIRRKILAGAKRSNAVIVQTEAMSKRMLIYAPQLNGRIHVIPSGIRTPSLKPMIRPEKKALIDSASRPRLIYVSHPSEHKNHINVVKALPSIMKFFPNTQLLLTLEKSDPPNARYATLIQEIARATRGNGVDKNLVWLGILTPDEVNYALVNCDLLVFPSLAESFGLGLVEAMAAGCPIVASDLPYARDVAREAAVYFDPTNPDDISQVVISTLSDSERLMQMKEKGLGLKEQYSYQQISQRIAALIESVIVEKNSR
jgi:glycosyltransferase involved in cell wall biosynthesis